MRVRNKIGKAGPKIINWMSAETSDDFSISVDVRH